MFSPPYRVGAGAVTGETYFGIQFLLDENPVAGREEVVHEDVAVAAQVERQVIQGSNYYKCLLLI